MIPYRRYTTTQIETASQERLMLSLFEAVTRNLNNAIELLDTGESAKAVPLLTQSSRIVLHLARTLKPEFAPELCETLAQLYLFVSLRLTMAAAKRDAKLVRDAQAAFQPLHEGFAAAVAQVMAQPAAKSA